MDTAKQKPAATAVRRQAEPILADAPPFNGWPRARAERYLALLAQLPTCPLYTRVRRMLANADALMGELESLADDLQPRALARSQAPLARYAIEYHVPDLTAEIVTARTTLNHFADALESTLPPVTPAKPKAK